MIQLKESFVNFIKLYRFLIITFFKDLDKLCIIIHYKILLWGWVINLQVHFSSSSVFRTLPILWNVWIITLTPDKHLGQVCILELLFFFLLVSILVGLHLYYPLQYQRVFLFLEVRMCWIIWILSVFIKNCIIGPRLLTYLFNILVFIANMLILFYYF